MPPPMAQVLRMAAEVPATVHPWPRVAALLIGADGCEVGWGVNSLTVREHAEVAALRMAGEGAKGATLWTNLEPCCNYGITRPCVRSILEAGVVEVHVALMDPVWYVRGAGLAGLVQNGVRVIYGEMHDEARRLNQRYLDRFCVCCGRIDKE